MASPDQRAEALAPAAIFVSAPGGEERLALEAAASGAAVLDADVDSVATFVTDAAALAQAAAEGRRLAEAQSFAAVAHEQAPFDVGPSNMTRHIAQLRCSTDKRRI